MNSTTRDYDLLRSTKKTGIDLDCTLCYSAKLPLQPQNTLLGFLSKWEILFCPKQKCLTLDAIMQGTVVKNGSRMVTIPNFWIWRHYYKTKDVTVLCWKRRRQRFRSPLYPSIGTSVGRIRLLSHKMQEATCHLAMPFLRAGFSHYSFLCFVWFLDARLCSRVPQVVFYKNMPLVLLEFM